MPTAAIMRGTSAAGSGAHPFNLEVNGTDLIGRVPLESITYDQPGPGSNGSMTFEVTDPTRTLTFAAWDHVRLIEHAAARSVLWGGFVASVSRRPAFGTGRIFTIECVGYGVLLDRRVVVDFMAPQNTSAMKIPDGIQAAATVWGNGIECYAYTPTNPADYTGDVTKTLFMPDPGGSGADWQQPFLAFDGLTLTDTLRGVIETWGEFGADLTPPKVGQYDEWPPIGFLYWVDSYKRLHAFWDKPTVASGYQGDAPQPLTDALPVANYAVTSLSFEEDNADLTHGVYVIGSGAGLGWAQLTISRPDALASAELQDIANNSLSTTAPKRDAFGRGYVDARQSTTVRGTLTTEDSQPWTVGQKLTLTNTALGIAAEEYRITAVRVQFMRGTTKRRNTITFGGSRGTRVLTKHFGTQRARSI